MSARPPVTAVHALRAVPVVDTELEWFFNRVECDMGIRSNFQRSVGRPGDEPSPESAAEAAHSYRLIRRWLLSIPDAHAGVLQAAYVIRPWPPRLYDDLGRLTGIVVRLACALDPWPADTRSREVIEAARAEWLAIECERCRGFVFSPVVRLRRDAEKRFALARHAYAGARGNGPAVSPV